MIEIPRGRNWQLVHTITDDGVALSDMREDGVAVPVRCQIRGKNAVRSPRTGFFELPLVVEVTATLTGATAEILTLYLSSTATKALHVGDYVMDAVAIWSDHEESLLVPEVVSVVNWPTNLSGLTPFSPETPPTVPDFVDDLLTAVDD